MNLLKPFYVFYLMREKEAGQSRCNASDNGSELPFLLPVTLDDDDVFATEGGRRHVIQNRRRGRSKWTEVWIQTEKPLGGVEMTVT